MLQFMGSQRVAHNLATEQPSSHNSQPYVFEESTIISISYIRRLTLRDGEGYGTPLQYSCLENPMDGGAWWAAVHGVAKVGHD